MNEKLHLVLSLADINAIRAAAVKSIKRTHGSVKNRQHNTIVLRGIELSGPQFPGQISSYSVRAAAGEVWKKGY